MTTAGAHLPSTDHDIHQPSKSMPYRDFDTLTHKAVIRYIRRKYPRPYLLFSHLISLRGSPYLRLSNTVTPLAVFKIHRLAGRFEIDLDYSTVFKGLVLPEYPVDAPLPGDKIRYRPIRLEDLDISFDFEKEGAILPPGRKTKRGEVRLGVSAVTGRALVRQ